MFRLIFFVYISFLFCNMSWGAEPQDFKQKSYKNCPDLVDDLDEAEISRRKKLAKEWSAAVPKIWCAFKYNIQERFQASQNSVLKTKAQEAKIHAEWLDLPDLCLGNIACILSLKDLIKFSQTCKLIHLNCEYAWKKLGKKILETKNLAKKPVQSWRNNILWRLWEIAREYKEVSLKQDDAKLDDGQLYFVVLEKAKFNNKDFSGSKWCHSKLREVIFENCNFKNADFCGAKLCEVEFKNCTLLGVSFHQTNLDTVKFEKSELPKSCFSFSKLHEGEFIECKLNSANFEHTKFFDDKFITSNLAHADFSDACIFYVTFNNIDLSHTKFSNTEAPGVQVKNSIVNKIRCMDKFDNTINEYREFWDSH